MKTLFTIFTIFDISQHIVIRLQQIETCFDPIRFVTYGGGSEIKAPGKHVYRNRSDRVTILLF